MMNIWRSFLKKSAQIPTGENKQGENNRVGASNLSLEEPAGEW